VFRFFGLATGHGALDEYREFKRFLASKGYVVGANGQNGAPKSRPERLLSSPEGKDTASANQDALRTAITLLRRPTNVELCQIAEKRGLSGTAPFMASELGCLLVGNVGGFESWVLTDAAGKCAEARRLDGALFPSIGTLKERKAHTLKGSKKNWPVGLVPKQRDCQRIRSILWVEGGAGLSRRLPLDWAL
jgi:hypothetical protein